MCTKNRITELLAGGNSVTHFAIGVKLPSGAEQATTRLHHTISGQCGRRTSDENLYVVRGALPRRMLQPVRNGKRFGKSKCHIVSSLFGPGESGGYSTLVRSLTDEKRD